MKRVSVIGMGRTGIAVAKFLHSLGHKVSVFDIKNLPVPQELAGLPINFHLGDPLYQGAEDADLIVVSPGVSREAPFIARAEAKGIPIKSEIEIAFEFCLAPIVAITGTDGKSTTTALLGHILRESGKKAIIAGNIGVPFIDVVSQITPQHIVVLEVSSFQLEWVDKFRPFVGVILNISPDHMERHRSLEEYARVKFRLFSNQNKEDYAILNAEDPFIMGMSSQVPSRVLLFSTSPIEGEGIFLEKGEINIRVGDSLCTFPLPFTSLRGRHNLQNLLAGILSAYLCGVPPEGIKEAIPTFQPLPHRLEEVGRIKGVLFVNDSKATNPHSAGTALSSFDAPIVWIAGGQLKEGTDYSALFSRHKGRLKGVVLIGESSNLLEDLARREGIDNIVKGESIEEAVEKAFLLASPGDVVLLSPACASFDMFRDFEERGERFKEAVKKLRWRYGSEGV